MFNSDFYPTPENIIELMTGGEVLANKTILEPSAGKGNIIDYLLLNNNVKSILACENNKDLREILKSKCKLVGDDFLDLTSDVISHIDFIIMNPPFTADEKHILHAFSIAPAGCKIIALCNTQTINNPFSKSRQELVNIVKTYGNSKELGSCFDDSERKTGVNITLIKLQKPGTSYNTEFEGFYMNEEPEEVGVGGLMPYNVVRDLVNRYIGAVKIFDKQLASAVEMNNLTKGFYSCNIGMDITENKAPIQREEFKKAMQKSGWLWIFNEMNMKKHTTRGLREDINKFVENQSNIPFTMKNIYKMLEIVIATTSQRMDKALLEVFEKVTSFHDDNKMGLPGWKTNSHYILTKRFIHPYLCPQDSFDKQYYPDRVKIAYNSRAETLDDMVKAICYLTGDNYDNFPELDRFVSANQNSIKFGEWFEWTYFKVRAYKKGTMHFEFKSEDLWAKFNQRISKLKGHPLYEHKEGSKPNNYGQTSTKQGNTATKREPIILSTIKLKIA